MAEHPFVVLRAVVLVDEISAFFVLAKKCGSVSVCTVVLVKHLYFCTRKASKPGVYLAALTAPAEYWA